MLMNTESHRWEGKWFLPGSSDRHFGTLEFDPTNGAKLRILAKPFSPVFESGIGKSKFDNKTPVITKKLNPGEHDAIYGEAEGKRITLLRAFNVSARSRSGDQLFHEEALYDAKVIIVGAHIPQIDEPIIARAHVSIDHLHNWLGGPTLLSVERHEELKSGLYDDLIMVPGNWPEGPPDSARLKDGTTITPYPRLLSPSLMWSAFEYEAKASEYHLLEITPGESLSLTDLKSFINRLSSLVSLGMDQQCSANHVQIEITGNPTPIKAYLLDRRHHPPASKETKREHLRTNFTCTNNNFRKLVERWFSIYELHSPPLGMLHSLRNGLSEYTEVSLVFAAILAESFHRSFYDEIGEEARSFHQALHPPRENRCGSSRPSLSERLIDLYCRLPQSVRELLIPDLKLWERTVVKTRNSLAHRARMDSTTPHAAAAASRVTIAVVSYLLLAELEICDKEFDEMARFSATFQSASFMAHEYLDR